MCLRKLFRRNEISLHRVHHTVYVNENGEKLKLVVNADPMRLVAGLNKAQKKMAEAVSKETPTDEERLEKVKGSYQIDEEMTEAAEYFAAVMFGKEQTAKLMEFYAGDASCVINVCGQVFKNQLTDKITKAQKQMG